MTSMSLPGAAGLLIIGVIATAILDLWALVLNRLFALPITNWGHVGRWVAGLPTGTVRHSSIGAATAVPYERALGWSTHYLIGVIYAVVYLLILSALGQTPGVFSAALFGIATVLAPWLILQPGLGMGSFARNTPKPNRTRTLNLIAHLVFGLGLYIGWRTMPLVS